MNFGSEARRRRQPPLRSSAPRRPRPRPPPPPPRRALPDGHRGPPDTAPARRGEARPGGDLPVAEPPAAPRRQPPSACGRDPDSPPPAPPPAGPRTAALRPPAPPAVAAHLRPRPLPRLARRRPRRRAERVTQRGPSAPRRGSAGRRARGGGKRGPADSGPGLAAACSAGPGLPGSPPLRTHRRARRLAGCGGFGAEGAGIPRPELGREPSSLRGTGGGRSPRPEAEGGGRCRRLSRGHRRCASAPPQTPGPVQRSRIPALQPALARRPRPGEQREQSGIPVSPGTCSGEPSPGAALGDQRATGPDLHGWNLEVHR